VRPIGPDATAIPSKESLMITLEQAGNIVDEALAHARRGDLPPMTVAVLDSAARLVAFAREDGSSLLREDIAQAKARGALNLGVGSRSLATRAATHPHFITAVTALAQGDLVPVPGGVLVRDTTDRIIGAVGVSGHLSDADEDCAVHAIAACGLRPDPGE
jgi:uncharacterized protein GlcG (DUF336 family)